METLKIDIRRRLGDFSLDLTLELRPGINILFGHSGVGKTQTLECLAGLIEPDEGQIQLGSKDFFKAVPGEPRVDLKPLKRNLGYVFQDGFLFPHKTILENVEYPLRKRGSEDLTSAHVLLDEMGMRHLGDRYPHQVSGGQRRRAAIARALASNARVLLLDEPFVHLDQVVRSKLIDDLVNLVVARRIIAVLVTHDWEVAARMADSISVMEAGRIVQTGPREDVLFKPASGQIARLFGDVNVMDATVEGESQGVWQVKTGSIVWRVPYVGALQAGQAVEVMIRAGSIKILKSGIEVPPALELNKQTASIERIDRHPDAYRVTLLLRDGIRLLGKIPSDTFVRTGLAAGESCQMAASIDGISLFPVELAPG